MWFDDYSLILEVPLVLTGKQISPLLRHGPEAIIAVKSIQSPSMYAKKC